MKLTPYQKRHLDALVYMRSEQPTLWRTLLLRPLSWLPFLLIFFASFGIYFYLDKCLGLLALGIISGATARVISHARLVLLAWPVNQTIIDWDKVEALRRDAAV